MTEAAFLRMAGIFPAFTAFISRRDKSYRNRWAILGQAGAHHSKRHAGAPRKEIRLAQFHRE